MTDLQILTLSLIQGITEFLPVSSSAHLIITSKLFGWSDQGLAIDVAVHCGTLLAVILYFWDYVKKGINGGIDIVQKKKTEDASFVMLIIVATIPIVIIGFLLKDLISGSFRQENIVSVIAFTSIIFGALLWLVDYATPTFSKVENLNYKHGMFLGCMQVIALIPGVSRSGICMTAGRLLGMERPESAKLSMLMGMPTLFAASVLIGFDIYTTENAFFNYGVMLAVVISFLFAYITIGTMMKLLEHFSMAVFASYRILLGIILLIYFT